VIRLENVSRTYGHGAATVHAVRELSTVIATGSFVTIVGASGSGKSTLLNLIGTLDTPSAGRIYIEDTELSTLDDNSRTRLRREKIGFVFQFFNLLQTLTAAENVAQPARLAGRSGRATTERAHQLLDRVGLSPRAAHRPDQLSGGEMQRVAIARALMMDPPVILADEPTGNLDSETGKKVLALLRDAIDGKRTVVLVTHDPKVASRGDRMLTMADGHLASDERPVPMPSEPPPE